MNVQQHADLAVVVSALRAEFEPPTFVARHSAASARRRQARRYNKSGHYRTFHDLIAEMGMALIELIEHLHETTVQNPLPDMPERKRKTAATVEKFTGAVYVPPPFEMTN